MRRVLISVLVVLGLTAGMALAAAYKTGKYKAGSQSGFKTPGIRIEIHRGLFNVEWILMHDTCTAPGHPDIHDFAGFEQGNRAALTGSITRRGNLSGAYRDARGNYTKVTGHISGSDLTVSGKEAGHYTPKGSSVTYSCSGSGKFHPKRVS